MTLEGVTTLDARYLCSSWAYCALLYIVSFQIALYEYEIVYVMLYCTLCTLRLQKRKTKDRGGWVLGEGQLPPPPKGSRGALYKFPQWGPGEAIVHFNPTERKTDRVAVSNIVRRALKIKLLVSNVSVNFCP